MTLAARVARLLRANLSARFGRVSPQHEPREPTRTSSASYRETNYSEADHRGAEGAAQPRAQTQSSIDPTLAGYYANLELPYGADRAAVRAARRRLLSRYHPDRFPGDPDRVRLANDLVQRLNHAHDELIKHLEKEKPHA